MDVSSLREAGLTEGEIKVYISLLELGSATTGPIVDKSGVARSIIYQILERLMEKGLVSYIVKEKTKYYQAAQPKKILDYIDERDKQLQTNKQQVEKLLPELLLKQALGKKQEATIYTGMKGVQTVHEKTYDRLKKGEEYFFMGIAAIQEEKFHLFWMRDHVRRIKAGITCKLLFNHDTEKHILANRNSYEGCDARYMPTKIITPAWFSGYKDVTVIGLQGEDAMAIEIVSQEIADSFQAYFKEYWKETKPFKEKS